MADEMTSEIWKRPDYVEMTTQPASTSKRLIREMLISDFDKFKALNSQENDKLWCKTCAYQLNEETHLGNLYTKAPMLRFIFGPVVGHTLILWDAKPNSSIEALKKLILPHCIQDIRLQQKSAEFSLETVQACSRKKKAVDPKTANDIYVRIKSDLLSESGSICVPKNLVGRVVDFLPARKSNHHPKQGGQKLLDWYSKNTEDSYAWHENYGAAVSVCIDFTTDRYYFKSKQKRKRNDDKDPDDGDNQVNQEEIDAYRRRNGIPDHDNDEIVGLGNVFKQTNQRLYNFLKDGFMGFHEIERSDWTQLEIGEIIQKGTQNKIWKPLDAVWDLVNNDMHEHEKKLACLREFKNKLKAVRRCNNVYWKQSTTRVGLLRTPEIRYVNGNVETILVPEYNRHLSKQQPCGVCPVCGLSGENQKYPIIDRKDVYCDLTDDSIDWTKLFIHFDCAKHWIKTNFDPEYHGTLWRLALRQTDEKKPDLPEIFKESMQSEMPAVDFDDMDGLLADDIINASDAVRDDENDGLARSDNISRTTVVQDENDLVNDILPAIPIDLEFAMSSMCITQKHNPFLVVL
tara:strand:- start:19559 stop:21274 length:1716 start_codon:yes stop_codon:yes gene_type:complete